jgi:hypothetical protein
LQSGERMAPVAGDKRLANMMQANPDLGSHKRLVRQKNMR